MERILLIALVFLIPRLCVAQTFNSNAWEFWSCRAEPEKFAAEFVGHPAFKPYGSTAPRPGRPAAEVEIYYAKRNRLISVGSEESMERWNRIAPGTKPDYKVDYLGEVVVYLTERDDARGVAMLREEVAKTGADAMVNVVRLACLNPAPTRNNHNWLGILTSQDYPVVGWGYYGVPAVRRDKEVRDKEARDKEARDKAMRDRNQQ